MRKGKRNWQAAGIAVVLGAALLTGCGSSDSDSQKAITTSQNSGEKTEAAGNAGTEMEESSSDTEQNPASADSTTIEEQTVLDADGVKVTAEEYVPDSIFGDGIRLLIENDSSVNIGVGSDAVIVNNYMITDIFSAEVAAGKKSNEMLYLMASELKASGIENVGQIELYLHLFDPDSYMTTYSAEPVTIRTSQYDHMDTEPNDDGQELYNNNGFRIVGKYVDEDSFWGNAIVLYLENNTDQNVIFQCDDMSVNGFMVTPYFSSTVYAGKMAISDITLMESELEENGIDSVNDVELTFHIVNADTYQTIVDTDPITFTAG